MSSTFELKLPFELSGDQPQAIEELTRGFQDQNFQTLLGVTGSGKTVTMASLIARHGRPAQGIHAIQVEVDRCLYLQGDGRTPGVGFDRIACLLEAIATGLGNSLLQRTIRDAAE